MATDRTRISVRLNKSQIGLIWTGLNKLVGSYAGIKFNEDLPATSYPFRVLPLPRGFDSGTFSPSMMNRTIALFGKLKPRRSTGGTFSLDSFDLRAAAYASRVALQLQRYEFDRALMRRPGSLKRKRVDRSTKEKMHKSIEKLEKRKKQVVKYLERAMKRAERSFVAERSRAEFKALSKEWGSHLRWMRFHIAYFKPFPRTGMRKTLQKWIDDLVAMAKKAVGAEGYAVRDEKALRHVIRGFMHDSYRRRLGEHHHLYMLGHRDDRPAQVELFAYVASRLELEETEMAKNRGKKTKAIYEQAAAKPANKARIDELRAKFDGQLTDELKDIVRKLLSDPEISVRGLSRDTGIPDATLRNCRDSAPQVKEAQAAKEPALVAKAPAPEATERHEEAPAKEPAAVAVEAQKPPMAKPAAQAEATRPASVASQTVPRRVNRAVALPPKPEEAPKKESPKTELARLILEFVEKFGPARAIRYPEDVGAVLDCARTVVGEIPSSSNQAPVNIPPKEERAEFFKKIRFRGEGDNLVIQVAGGLRNIQSELNVDGHTWNAALDEANRIIKEVEEERRRQSQPAPSDEPNQKPHKQFAQIRQTDGWRGQRPSVPSRTENLFPRG